MAQIVVGLFAGILGVAYFMYGKREQRISALISGAALCVYPYFVENVVWLIVIGIACLVLPFVVEF